MNRHGVAAAERILHELNYAFAEIKLTIFLTFEPIGAKTQQSPSETVKKQRWIFMFRATEEKQTKNALS